MCLIYYKKLLSREKEYEIIQIRNMDDIISGLTKLSSKTDEEEYIHLLDVIERYKTLTISEEYSFIREIYSLIKRYNESFLRDLEEHNEACIAIKNYTKELLVLFTNSTDTKYILNLSYRLFNLIKQEVDDRSNEQMQGENSEGENSEGENSEGETSQGESFNCTSEGENSEGENSEGEKEEMEM
jgi:hypothetical protein